MRRAGSGADEIARRAALKEAELQGQIDGLRQWRVNWEAGAEGERAVGAVLDGLATSGWMVLHDVRWPGRPRANIDHIAIGPGGAVVLDAKNWSGTVTVKDRVPRQNGYRRDKALHGSCSAAGAVTAMLEARHRASVTAAICFVQQAIEPATVPPGVVLVGLPGLRPWLTALPAVLSRAEVSAIHKFLARELAGPRSPDQRTTAQLEKLSQPAPHEPPAAQRRRAQPRPTPVTPRPTAGTPRPIHGPAPASTRRAEQGSGRGVVKLVVAAVVVLVSLTMPRGLAERDSAQPPPAAVVPAASLQPETVP